MEQLRHQRATWEPVERPVEFNDFVVFDFESHVEGKPLINQKGVQYQLIQGEPFLVPGFVEQIVGMRRDEEKEFKIQFSTDYPKAELAGKEGSFKVRVSEVKQEKAPELNDDFAKEINPEFKTLDALRKQISTNLNLRAEEKARIDFEEKVMDEVIKLSELEYPPVLVETEIDHVIEQQLRRWQMGGGRPEDYLKNIKKTAEELREEFRPIAVKRVTRVLVLGKVSEEEKIEVSGADIDAEVKNMTEEAAEKKDELEKMFNTASARDSVKQFLIARKAKQRLVEIAKGSNITSETKQEEEEK
jgi:trigger factor